MNSESTVITVFEDTTSLLPEFNDHLDNLNVLKSIVGSNNLTIQADGSFCIMHYVGFFQKGKTRVQILPKIYRGLAGADAAIEASSSLSFVYRLLHWSGFLLHRTLKPQRIGSSETDLIEIFIGRFIEEFINLFSKRVHRRYEEHVESQQFIKGKILFSETLRRNPILRHRHIVRFDDFTMNNPLNQVFKSLMLLLIRTTKSKENKARIVIGLNYLEEVDQVSLTKSLFDSIRFNRLNTEVEPLFNLARLFFLGKQPGLTEGDQNTFSFLVPLNSLFEQFVSNLLSPLATSPFEFHFKGNNKYLLSSQGQLSMLLKPDYTITKENQIITILDAKYKCPVNSDGIIELNEKDVYQLCTYALRYDVRNLVLIYPKFVGTGRNETCLANYQIAGGVQTTNLSIIQIDVLQEDLSLLTNSLREIYPILTQDENSVLSQIP